MPIDVSMPRAVTDRRPKATERCFADRRTNNAIRQNSIEGVFRSGCFGGWVRIVRGLPGRFYMVKVVCAAINGPSGLFVSRKQWAVILCNHRPEQSR